MYSLDINFLKDRPDYKKDVPKPKTTGQATIQDPKPIFIGLGAAVAINSVVIASMLIFQGINSNLQQDLDALNTKLAKLNAEVKNIEAIKAKANKFKEEADALATVFNDIKPWSSLLGELGSVMPGGMKVARINQKEIKIAAAPAPSKGKAQEPPPAPKVRTVLEISGTANSYGEVNDFLLLLERSPFFQEEETKLLSARKTGNPAKLELKDSQSELTPELPKLPQVVDYRIEVSLSDRGASELLPQLKQHGAVGLVDRIETLQQKGVI